MPTPIQQWCLRRFGYIPADPLMMVLMVLLYEHERRKMTEVARALSGRGVEDVG